MQRSKLFAFNFKKACSSYQQSTFRADILIPSLDLLCEGIVKRDLHSGKLTSNDAWVDAMISEESASNLLHHYIDVDEVFFTQKLYLEIEDSLFQMIEDDSILDFVYTSNQISDDLPAFWDSIDLEAMARGHVHYEDQESDEIEIIRIH